MKPSALLTSLASLLHLLIIDGTFVLFKEHTAINYLFIITYNIIWLTIALLIWNHGYNNTNSKLN